MLLHYTLKYVLISFILYIPWQRKYKIPMRLKNFEIQTTTPVKWSQKDELTEEPNIFHSFKYNRRLKSFTSTKLTKNWRQNLFSDVHFSV